MEERTDAKDLFYEQMIITLRPQIEEEMTPSHVVFFLPKLSDVATDIMKAERRSRKEGVALLIDTILARRDLGWYTAFVDALNAAGFDKLAKRLSFKDVKNDEVFKSLISHCMPDLLKIQLMPVMGYLLQEKVISNLDMDEVIKMEREGHHVAVFDLLSRLSMRRENWFEPFVLSLKKNKERLALNALDPLLDSAVSDESVRRVLTDIEKGNTEDFKSDPEKLKKLSEDDVSLDAAAGGKESPEESRNDTMEEVLEFHESRQPSLEVNAPNVNLLTTYQDKDYSKEEKLPTKQVGVAKPMVAGGPLESSDLNNPLDPSNSQRTPNETRAKEVLTDSASGGETQIKQPVVGTATRLNQAIQETTPKTLGGVEEQSISRRTMVYHQNRFDSNEEGYDLRSDAFPGNAQAQRNVVLDSASDSCSDNNCQRSRTNSTTSSQSNQTSGDQSSVLGTLIPDGNQLPESVERRVVPYEIFVSNIPTYVTKDEIVDHFGMIGDIKLNAKGEPRVHLYRDKTTGELKGEALITYANEVYANAAVDIFNETEFEGSMLKVEIAWRKVRSPSSVQRSAAFEEETASSLDGSTLVPEGIYEDLELRSYQEELAAKAKAGDNCVIVAPTGSGKTHVAMEIIRHHIEKLQDREKSPKIVFFVPTVALVEQQRKQFEKYLQGRKILGLSGDQDAKLPLSELVPLSDIIVMTPQILENALKENDIDTLSLFSLMIFDECHHTSKNHPYNMIMSHYIDENLGRSRRHPMPQVVGLTASVGVGKSKSMEQAVTCILRLCANMDAVEICTVREHLPELIRHVNRPEENTTELSGRKEDPFFNTISAIIGVIEDKMKNSEYTRDAVKENAEFGRLLQAPAERGGDRYTQWMSRLQKPVDAIYLQKTRRFYVACLKDLRIYNTALLINADCRTKDALDYIVKEFNPAMVDNLHEFSDDTDFWLKGLFEAKKECLNRVSRDPKYENPKLNHLKNIVCEEYRKAPDSRGIIFCKTREMTVALVNWMNDTPDLKKLNPHNLVGSNAPSNKAGMTQVKQEDVLTYFKRGNHRLIVATSVAEEGLDVQKCNIVIRYEHVTNQIARVQSRGRARADNAQYLVVAEKGRGAAEKEECNKIREKMMQKAIDIIDRYGTNEKREKIRQYQKEAQVEREMAKKGKEISKLLKASQNTDGRYVLRCLKCDSFAAYSTDIRKIEASHHVILDKYYKERIIIRPHPAPKKFENFELTGKIFCKKCHSDWGIMGVYKKVSFPVVKVCSFIVINEDDQREVYKRWKEVPFNVKTISPDDLQEMMDQHRTDSAQPSSDDEGDFLNEDTGEFGTMYE